MKEQGLETKKLRKLLAKGITHLVSNSYFWLLNARLKKKTYKAFYNCKIYH